MTEARLNAANDLNTSLRELRELAEKATPGPWQVLNEVSLYRAPARPPEDDAAEAEWDVWFDQARPLTWGEFDRAEDAAFIAACSPSLLLALTEVAAKAAAYADCEDMAYEELRAALARLSVCFSGAQPSHEEGSE